MYSESLYEDGQALPVFLEPLETPVRPETKKYPLAFVQGHSRFRTHSMFANVDSLLEMNPEPVVEINPQDATERNISNDDKDKAEKCNLCSHRIAIGLEPFCLVCCEGQAIHFGDFNDPNSTVSQMVKSGESFRLKPDEGTEPAVFYLSPKKPRGL